MKFTFPVLAGDIGGTNARYTVIDSTDAAPGLVEQVRNDSHPTIEAGIETAVIGSRRERPKSAVLAMACPIEGDRFRLTNADRTIEPAAFMEALGLESLVVMNDFVAQGLAAASLGETDLQKIGGGTRDATAPRIVIGPGTGLGVATVVNVSGKWAVVPGEGGHVDLGPRSGREFEIWPWLDKQNGRMSMEEAVSGRGLENLYRAILRAGGHPIASANASQITASRITSAALDGTDGNAREAVTLMTLFLARYAGDLALVSMAKGGVYLTGGITRHVLPFLRDPGFRAEFENKSPMSHILAEIPIHVMAHPQPALAGISRLVTGSPFDLSNAVRIYRKGGAFGGIQA